MEITELHPEPAPQSAAVTVYTTPACPQCTLTKNWLTREGVEHAVVNVAQDPAALRYVKETLGYATAPVTVIWTEGMDDPAIFQGFRPDLLERYTQTGAAA